MADRDPSRPDAYKQTGDGLRELLQRFNAARTREEFQWIAAEAARRGARPGLEPTLETAYGVLVSLVRTRVTALTAGESTAAEGAHELDKTDPNHLNVDGRGAAVCVIRLSFYAHTARQRV